MKYHYFIGYTELDTDGAKYNKARNKMISLDEMLITEEQLNKMNEDILDDISGSDTYGIVINSINFLHAVEEEIDKKYIDGKE